MKKKIFLSFLIIILVMMLVNTGKVSANIENVSSDIYMEGAQIRTTGNAGIRFVGNASKYDTSNVSKYGILIAYGSVNDIDSFYLGSTINGLDTYSAEVDDINNMGRFYLCIYNVPVSEYHNIISARAYVIDGENIIYSENIIERSLYSVAEKAYMSGDRSEFVIEIYNTEKPEPSGPFNITYNLNGGIWGYASKEEMAYEFLSDFYDFVGYEGTLDEFINGAGATSGYRLWTNYVGEYFRNGTNKLLNETLDVNDENYFFNCKAYKEKWAMLGEWVYNLNGRFGKAGYLYGGTIDFYRYIINDSQGYDDIYGDNFYLYPSFNEPSIYTYDKGDEILLPVPYGKKFSGWYLNSDLTGEKIEKITSDMYGDIELFASWNNAVTYEIRFNTNGGNVIESMTVAEGEIVNLPKPIKDGYLFDGWKYNGELVDMEFVYEYGSNITLVAEWINNLEDLVINGSKVTYRNSSTVVQIPKVYEQKAEEFRGVWVTSYTGDFTPSSNKETMMANLTSVLDKMAEYNMNAIIFHVRYTNNAAYKTKMAPIASGYGTYETFEEWDYLEWFIEECHNRGIEFHAWLNPYRIKSYGYPSATTAEDVAATYKDYPLNAASNPDNILMTYRDDGTHGAILNPAKEEVQDYIVDVCLELMENYDIDAIHFDDYFYAQMSSGVTVLTEPDQDDYEEFIDNNPTCGYSKSSSSDKKQWRRDNVDSFIYKLHTAMTEFNKENYRAVQLGIAPTGIYKNGNGSVSSGSNTGGQEHYASYLFCDTKKWVLEEWIDYILPQTYWGFTHSSAGYANVVDWWNAVVSGTDVNLYTGMGIYMSTNYSSAYSWTYENNYEVSLQVLYNTKFSNVKGTCIFSFQYLYLLEDENAKAYNGMMRLKNEYWTSYVPTPSTMASQYLN